MTDHTTDVSRVRRSTHEARDWYDSLSRWYDRLIDPFEGPARAAGVEVLRPTAGERILDVGCGTGSALVEIGHAIGEDGTAIGVDVADGMCRIAHRKIDDADLGHAAVVTGDGLGLPLSDDAFDAVFASFVLELFDTSDLSVALAEWRRVLEPGGRLCVVALSRRHGGPATAAYERIHRLFPRHVDCRPIYVRETLDENGFHPTDVVEGRAWGLPVEIVLARARTDRPDS